MRFVPLRSAVSLAVSALFAAGCAKSEPELPVVVSASSLRDLPAYEIVLVLNDSDSTFFGAMTVATPTEPVGRDMTAVGTNGQVRFRLYPRLMGGDLLVESVQLVDRDGTATDVTWAMLRRPDLLQVNRGAQDPTTVYVEFRGRVPANTETSYGVLSRIDDIWNMAQPYPVLVPWVSGQPWDDPLVPWSDPVVGPPAAYTVWVVTDQPVRMVGSGTAVDSSVQPGYSGLRRLLTNHDKNYVAASERSPARDFAFSILPEQQDGAFQDHTAPVGTGSNDPGVVHVWAPPDNRDVVQVSLDVASEALRLFSATYSTYPYGDLRIVYLPIGALGVEYPGFIVMSDAFLSTNGFVAGGPVSFVREASIAHEVAHQWFYGVLSNNQAREPWLDEAFAQYLTYRYYDARYGPTAADQFRASLMGRWERVNGEMIPIGQPVSAYAGRAYGAIVYGAAALALIELEETVGRSGMDSFIRELFERFQWSVWTNEDFKTLAREWFPRHGDDWLSSWPLEAE